MIETLITLRQEIAKPDVIIVISAHWEEAVVKVTAGEKPDLIYDYYGFPEQAYSLKYPAKGNAEFATIKKIVKQVSIPVVANGDIDSPQKS